MATEKDMIIEQKRMQRILWLQSYLVELKNFQRTNIRDLSFRDQSRVHGEIEKVYNYIVLLKTNPNK